MNNEKSLESEDEDTKKRLNNNIYTKVKKEKQE